MAGSTAYKNSIILDKFKKREKDKNPIKIAFLDIDSTLTGDSEDAIVVRKLLNSQGYGVVFVTSRTEEMLMSRAEFEKSKQNGILRRTPRLKVTKEGKRIPAFPDDVEEFAGLYNPDVIASNTGTRILVRQVGGGYLEDKDFSDLMGDSPKRWREMTLKVLKMVDPGESLFKFAPIESEENFEEGKTDVEPPNYRIQLFFEPGRIDRIIEQTGSTSVRASLSEEEKIKEAGKKIEFIERLNHLREDPTLPKDIKSHLANIRVNDDSNPDRGKFCVYLTPAQGSKSRAVDTIMDNLSSKLEIEEMLYVGDSMPDLYAGLYAGYKAKIRKFLLVSGSRLTSHLIINSIRYFAGEPIFEIKKRITKGKKEGVLTFNASSHNRSGLILGEYAYPGTKYVSTVRAFLESQQESLANLQ